MYFCHCLLWGLAWGFLLLMADFPATAAYYGVWLGVSTNCRDSINNQSSCGVTRRHVTDFKYLFTHFTAQRQKRAGGFIKWCVGVGGWMAQGRRGPPLLSGGIWGCPGWSPAPDEKHPTVFFGPRPLASSTLPATACQTQTLAKIDQSPARKEVECHEVHMVQVRGADARGTEFTGFSIFGATVWAKQETHQIAVAPQRPSAGPRHLILTPRKTTSPKFSSRQQSPSCTIGLHLGRNKAARSALGPN